MYTNTWKYVFFSFCRNCGPTSQYLIFFLKPTKDGLPYIWDNYPVKSPPWKVAGARIVSLTFSLGGKEASLLRRVWREVTAENICSFRHNAIKISIESGINGQSRRKNSWLKILYLSPCDHETENRVMCTQTSEKCGKDCPNGTYGDQTSTLLESCILSTIVSICATSTIHVVAKWYDT